MDELRYGTRTIQGKKWMSKGHRPTSPMKYGYKYNYLFQATQPSSGKTFEMFLPNMSGECFKIFLKNFSQSHPNQTMIMDNAGCHHVGWMETEEKPDTTIIYLPPYSPDFNPQERIFQEIKKPLKGKIFNDLKSIEKIIMNKIKEFEQSPQTVKDLTAWKWIVNHNS
jgi:transposase